MPRFWRNTADWTFQLLFSYVNEDYSPRDGISAVSGPFLNQLLIWTILPQLAYRPTLGRHILSLDSLLWDAARFVSSQAKPRSTIMRVVKTKWVVWAVTSAISLRCCLVIF